MLAIGCVYIRHIYLKPRACSLSQINSSRCRMQKHRYSAARIDDEREREGTNLELCLLQPVLEGQAVERGIDDLSRRARRRGAGDTATASRATIEEAPVGQLTVLLLLLLLLGHHRAVCWQRHCGIGLAGSRARRLMAMRAL